MPPDKPSRSIPKKPLIIAVGLLLGLVALARLPLIFVLNSHSGEFLASSYKFEEDNFNHPRLELLRKQEHLDQIVAAGHTQFEKILLLRHWVYTRWRSNASFYYPAWDAAEILDLSRKYKNNGFCAQYAIVFLQACQALGIHARYIEPQNHFIVGVWSDDYDLWVLMDPSIDIHFEKDGIPLRGRVICSAYWTNKLQGIFRVRSDGTKTPVTKKDLEPFKMYSIVERADQLAHPALIQVNDGAWRELHRESDYHNYPLIGRDKLVIGSPYLAWDQKGSTESVKNRALSSDRDDFRYVFNQTLIFIARRNKEKGLLKLILYDENSPTFESFRVKLDTNEWQSVGSDLVFWELKPGVNKISARVRTQHGWEGPISTLEVFYKPTWF